MCSQYTSYPVSHQAFQWHGSGIHVTSISHAPGMQFGSLQSALCTLSHSRRRWSFGLLGSSFSSPFSNPQCFGFLWSCGGWSRNGKGHLAVEKCIWHFRQDDTHTHTHKCRNEKIHEQPGNSWDLCCEALLAAVTSFFSSLLGAISLRFLSLHSTSQGYDIH